MTEDEERSAVIAAAREWLCTPHIDNARVKGAGVDCAQLVCDAFEQAGLIPHIDPKYPSQWGLHNDRELFIEWIMDEGGVRGGRPAHEITRDQVQKGDLACFKFGRVHYHGVIFTSPDTIIHADMHQGVIEERITENEKLRIRIEDGRARYFTLWK